MEVRVLNSTSQAMKLVEKFKNDGWKVELNGKESLICRKDDALMVLTISYKRTTNQTFITGGEFKSKNKVIDDLLYLLKVRTSKLRENRIGYQFYDMLKNDSDVLTFKEMPIV